MCLVFEEGESPIRTQRKMRVIVNFGRQNAVPGRLSILKGVEVFMRSRSAVDAPCSGSSEQQGCLKMRRQRNIL